MKTINELLNIYLDVFENDFIKYKKPPINFISMHVGALKSYRLAIWDECVLLYEYFMDNNADSIKEYDLNTQIKWLKKHIKLTNGIKKV